MQVDAYVPSVLELRNLEADTAYFIYIGGVSSQGNSFTPQLASHLLDTLYHYARVTTLSSDIQLPLALSHAARLDLVQPMPSSPSLCINAGGAVPLQAVLSTQAVMQLISHVCALDCPNHLWENTAVALENALRKHYRHLLSQDEVRKRLSSHGNLFVAGEMEVGAYLVEILRPYCEETVFRHVREGPRDPATVETVSVDGEDQSAAVANVQVEEDDDDEEPLPRIDTGLIVEDIQRDLCLCVLGLLLRMNRYQF